jgi:hypothetical protein
MRCPLPELEIPDIDFGSFVFERVRRQLEKTALIDAARDRSVTFGKLLTDIDSAAGGLVADGLRTGGLAAID